MLRKNKAFNTKAISLLISIVFAIGVWSYVVYVENPERTDWIRKIPVTVSGEAALNEKGFALKDTENVTIDLKIRTKRSNFKHLSAGTITAVADVSNLNKTGEHTVAVSVSFPASASGVNVVDRKNVNVDFNLEKYTTSIIPIEPLIAHHPAGEYSLHEDFENLAIEVSGGKSAVDSISYITTSPVDLSNAVSDVETQLSLIAVDSDGNEVENVSIDSDKIPVTFKIYRTHSFNVEADIGTDSPYVTTTIEPTKVSVIGPAETISEWVSEGKSLQTAPINENNYRDGYNDTISILEWPEDSTPVDPDDKKVNVIFTKVEVDDDTEEE